MELSYSVPDMQVGLPVTQTIFFYENKQLDWVIEMRWNAVPTWSSGSMLEIHSLFSAQVGSNNKESYPNSIFYHIFGRVLSYDRILILSIQTHFLLFKNKVRL